MTTIGMPREDDPDRERGLYQKFMVERMNVEAAERHKDCDFFVLDLQHDALALPAMEAYIKACREHGYHKLAADLQQKIDDVQGMAVEA